MKSTLLFFFGVLLLSHLSNNSIIQSTAKPNSISPLVQLKDIVRSIDGTNNNPLHPSWGSANQNQYRMCSPPNYADQQSVMVTNLPNPRIVSNLVGSIGTNITTSKANWNTLFPIWGQFVTHDISATKGASTESVPIVIPKGDIWFDPLNTGTQTISFTRDAYDPSNPVRTQINSNTAWLDGSAVYGSSTSIASSLRTMIRGKLIASSDNMLPKGSNGFYKAGDSRVI
jgi:hypothetical protein